MGAKCVDDATIGLMQNIVPSMSFLESVLLFGEPLSFRRCVIFVLIWAVLAMYTGDAGGGRGLRSWSEPHRHILAQEGAGLPSTIIRLADAA